MRESPRVVAYVATTMLLALGVILGVSRVFGELARRFNQPAVLGEILAGVVLGPTVLGRITMTLCLLLYVLSVWLAGRIMDIEV